ncbi:MAG: Hsp70 family protein, partial [bacterium]|nr:Hsp70 family protein [bacterium]
KDKATGKANTIKITGSTGLSKDEVEKMKQEAEEHAADDTAKKERIEVRNRADSMVYTAEKALKDAGDKVAPDLKTEVEEKIKALKDILETGSKEDLEAKTSELSESLQKIGAQAYSQKETPPQSEGEAQANGEQKAEDKKEAEEGEVVS